MNAVNWGKSAFLRTPPRLSEKSAKKLEHKVEAIFDIPTFKNSYPQERSGKHEKKLVETESFGFRRENFGL